MKYIFYPIFLLVIVLEIFFQIIFLNDIKSLKKTILFFNPYCEQSYWNFESNLTYDRNKSVYHPTLSIIKKKNQKYFQKKEFKNNEIVFYGSSFIDHKYFIPNYQDKINFAIKSYGLDQIYESYMLTKENFVNSTVIFGFLLEDLDRVIFDRRSLPKLKYIKKNGNFELTNTPILLEEIKKKQIHFYTYKFVRNLFFLITNEFDYKKSTCFEENKKEIFKHFINTIVNNSKKFNQKVIFVTFNFKNDVINPNWRYPFVKLYLMENNFNHIDATHIIRKKLKFDNSNLSDFYNQEDFHLSKKGFKIIKDEIDKFIELYK